MIEKTEFSPKEETVFPEIIHEKIYETLRSSLPSWDGLPEKVRTLPEYPNGRSEFRFTHDDAYGKEIVTIEIPSIRELFRGDSDPGEIERYPEKYIPFFHFLEIGIAVHAEMFLAEGKKFSVMDNDFIEIYSALRRRPDGKRINTLHDILWRDVVIFLLFHRCSAKEYEACIRRLERSVRKFHINPASCNYFNYIFEMMKSCMEDD